MNLKNIIKRLFLLDAHYPRTIISFIFLFTIFFMWKIHELKIDPGLRSLVPKNHKIVKNMELAEDLFSSNEIAIIAVDIGLLLYPKSSIPIILLKPLERE